MLCVCAGWRFKARGQLKDKLIEPKQYIDKNDQDMPEIRGWRWGAGRAEDMEP